MQNIHHMKQFQQAIARLVTTHGLPYTTTAPRPNKEVSMTVNGLHSFYIYPTSLQMKNLVDEMVANQETHLIFVTPSGVIIAPKDGKYAPLDVEMDEEATSTEEDELDAMKNAILEEGDGENEDPELDSKDGEEGVSEEGSTTPLEKDSGEGVTEGTNVTLVSVEGNPEALEPYQEGEDPEEDGNEEGEVGSNDESESSENDAEESEDDQAGGEETTENASAPTAQAPATRRNKNRNRNRNRG